MAVFWIQASSSRRPVIGSSDDGRYNFHLLETFPQKEKLPLGNDVETKAKGKIICVVLVT